jgi:hypothetical protein
MRFAFFTKSARIICAKRFIFFDIIIFLFVCLFCYVIHYVGFYGTKINELSKPIPLIKISTTVMLVQLLDKTCFAA